MRRLQVLILTGVIAFPWWSHASINDVDELVESVAVEEEEAVVPAGAIQGLERGRRGVADVDSGDEVHRLSPRRR